MIRASTHWANLRRCTDGVRGAGVVDGAVKVLRAYQMEALADIAVGRLHACLATGGRGRWNCSPVRRC
ncbi:hypothetical protein [Gordonia sp. DT218]|uniref:hypothetical protein n=1 Tax=Gordonia sp. DT218 TaxID=3416659 RepID=UPI003CEB03C5